MEQFTQRDNISYIINNFGQELWVQVCGKKEMNRADGYFWAGLLPNDKIQEAIITSDWEHQEESHQPGFVVYGNGTPQFDRYSGFEYEPLLFSRNFNGVKENYIEISEEFRLLNNLYHDIKRNKYIAILENGDQEDVIKVEYENVFIKLNYLKRYAAVKQMAIVLYFDIRYDSLSLLEEMELEEFNQDYMGPNYCFNYCHYNDTFSFGKRKSYSLIHGKKILFGVGIEESGYWPYDQEKKYEDFIIGIDSEGREVNYSSNPNGLSNYFTENPTSPHYLTPVYFSKEVLNKYYSNPDVYEVNDGHIRRQGIWLLQVDNLNNDYVSAYLGDLGRDLPYKEQLYWKSFNILHDGKISETKFKRDFLAQFADPEIADFKFKQSFVQFNKKWSEKFNWDLFLELSEKDKYNFEHLRIPVVKSQAEFDTLVLSLVKTVIDSLNEKELTRAISDEDIKGSISKLEKYFEINGIKGYEEHIKFLRALQQLRSTGTGHRKGKSYDKVASKFKIEDSNFSEVFELILISAISFIEFLDMSFLKEEIIESTFD